MGSVNNVKDSIILVLCYVKNNNATTLQNVHLFKTNAKAAVNLCVSLSLCHFNFKNALLFSCVYFYHVYFFSEYWIMAGNMRARVIWPNIRLTNGVMHIVDNLLLNENRQSSEWTGQRPSDSAHTNTPTMILLVSLLLFTWL